MSAFLSDVAGYYEILRYPLGAALCLIGGLLSLVGAVGVIRFPDFYTRLHGASVTETSGASLLLLGMVIIAPHWLVMAKLVTIWFLLFITSPTSTHAIANAAHVAGLQPLTGRQDQDDDKEASL